MDSDTASTYIGSQHYLQVVYRGIKRVDPSSSGADFERPPLFTLTHLYYLYLLSFSAFKWFLYLLQIILPSCGPENVESRAQFCLLEKAHCGLGPIMF